MGSHLADDVLHACGQASDKWRGGGAICRRRLFIRVAAALGVPGSAAGVAVASLRSPAPTVELRRSNGYRRKHADAARNVAIAAAEERTL